MAKPQTEAAAIRATQEGASSFACNPVPHADCRTSVVCLSCCSCCCSSPSLQSCCCWRTPPCYCFSPSCCCACNLFCRCLCGKWAAACSSWRITSAEAKAQVNSSSTRLTLDTEAERRENQRTRTSSNIKRNAAARGVYDSGSSTCRRSAGGSTGSAAGAEGSTNSSWRTGASGDEMESHTSNSSSSSRMKVGASIRERETCTSGSKGDGVTAEATAASHSCSDSTSNARYDRQIRIWGEHGQRALQQASVLLLGSSAVAAEVLRNLVLLGVRRFLIVDDAAVCASDLCSSWLAAGDIGSSRAASVAREALSLNPEAQGAYICAAAETYVEFCIQAAAAAAECRRRHADHVELRQQQHLTLSRVAAVSAAAETTRKGENEGTAQQQQLDASSAAAACDCCPSALSCSGANPAVALHTSAAAQHVPGASHTYWCHGRSSPAVADARLSCSQVHAAAHSSSPFSTASTTGAATTATEISTATTEAARVAAPAEAVAGADAAAGTTASGALPVCRPLHAGASSAALRQTPTIAAVSGPAAVSFEAEDVKTDLGGEMLLPCPGENTGKASSLTFISSSSLRPPCPAGVDPLPHTPAPASVAGSAAPGGGTATCAGDAAAAAPDAYGRDGRLTELKLQAGACVPFPAAFSLVVATQQPLHTLLLLGKLCGLERSVAASGERAGGSNSLSSGNSSSRDDARRNVSNESRGSSTGRKADAVCSAVASDLSLHTGPAASLFGAFPRSFDEAAAPAAAAPASRPSLHGMAAEPSRSRSSREGSACESRRPLLVQMEKGDSRCRGPAAAGTTDGRPVELSASFPAARAGDGRSPHNSEPNREQRSLQNQRSSCRCCCSTFYTPCCTSDVRSACCSCCYMPFFAGASVCAAGLPSGAFSPSPSFPPCPLPSSSSSFSPSSPFSIPSPSTFVSSSSLFFSSCCSGVSVVPLVAVTSVGLLGVVRVCAGEYCVVERKAAAGDASVDLRLFDPFPELLEFAKSIDIDNLDDVAHAQVPYVVLLIQAAERWREQQTRRRRRQAADGTSAATEERAEALNEKDFDETGAKQGILQILESMRRHPEEVNFDEATTNVYRVLKPHSPPEEVLQVLEEASAAARDSGCSRGHACSSSRSCCCSKRNGRFWKLARAVSAFQRACKKLPLKGVIPDMTCDSSSFLRLQQLYAKRAEGDCNAIKASVAIQTKHAQAPACAACLDPDNETSRTSHTQMEGVLWPCFFVEEDAAAGPPKEPKDTREPSAVVGSTADHPFVEGLTCKQMQSACTQPQEEQEAADRASDGSREDASFLGAATSAANLRVCDGGGRACSCCGPAPEEIEMFARNAQELKVIRYRTLLEEYEPSSIRRATYEDAAAAVQACANGCTDEGISLLPWYICLWGAHRFAKRRGYFPGTDIVRTPLTAAEITSASGAKSGDAPVRCGAGLIATPGAVADDSRCPADPRYRSYETRQEKSVITAADVVCSPLLEGDSEAGKKEDMGDDAESDLRRDTLDRSRRDEYALQEEISKLLSELKCDGLEVSNHIIRQFVAFGGAELHSCAALVGGVAAQEAVKLICKQFEPINNTFIWCGVERVAQVLEL